MTSLDDLERRLRGLVPKHEVSSFDFVERRPPAKIGVEALDALGRIAAQPAELRQKAAESGALLAAFERAVAELAANVTELETLVGPKQGPAFAYVTWAWRVHQGLSDCWRTGFDAPDPASPAPAAWPEIPLLPARAVVLPPLAPATRSRFSTADALLELASRETAFVQRRRRLLETARRALLETHADVEAPGDAVQERLLFVAEQIRGLNALQSAGVSPTVDVMRQLRQATARHDATAVASCLSALRLFVDSGGAAPSLRRFLARATPRLPAAVRSLAPRQASDDHPSGVLEAATRGIEQARAERAASGGGLVARQLSGQALGPKAVPQLFAAAASVDGCFELGRSVAPVRASEEQARLRPVPYPTQTMVLRPAETVAEITNSVIGDPRLLLLDFATGRLLTRSYLAAPVASVGDGERVSEVRYYLLDGSDSMTGRRGLMRDALLLSELSSLIGFLSRPGAAPVRPVVYYRYFARHSEPTRRVATREEALEAIESCLGRLRRGGTDIESALVTSLDEIRREREKDENLKRVHLVLVSDGIAPVDLQRVWAARKRLGAIPVGVSVIALGAENEALKQLAAAQRRQGEEVFYHYLPERSIRELIEPKPAPAAPRRPEPSVEETRSAAPLPAEPATPDAPDDDAWQELEALVDELFALETRSDVDAIEQAQVLLESLSEVGLSVERDYGEAQRARLESLTRDERMLQRRFDRWFPPQPSSDAAGSPPAPASGEPMATIEAVLAAVAEIVDLLDGSPLQRRYDAIEVVERLLLEAAIPPWLYARELESPSPLASAAVTGVRRSAAARG